MRWLWQEVEEVERFMNGVSQDIEDGSDIGQWIYPRFSDMRVHLWTSSAKLEQIHNVSTREHNRDKA